MCAQRFGHNLNALSYFSDIYRERYSEVIRMAARELPQDPKNKDDGIKRFFQFNYGHVIPVPAARPDGAGAMPLQHLGKLPRSVFDFHNFFEVYRVGADDTLLFPSIDFYSLVGLLSAIRWLPADQVPSCKLRFIGVLESSAAEISNADAEHYWTKLLKAALERFGDKIKLAAETPCLADYLTDLLNAEIETVPYYVPDIDPQTDLDQGPLVFGFIGSPRPDKGFERIHSILKIANNVLRDKLKRSPIAEVRYLVQCSPAAQIKGNEEYLTKLYSLGNVNLLLGNFDQTEVLSAISASDVIVLPYDAQTYRTRGSAIMMEALLCSRAVIAAEGTAFGRQAAAFEAGWVCDTDTEFGERIASSTRLSRRALRDRAARARSRYVEQTRTAFEKWGL